MAITNIEWTKRVWNPTAGCTKVSASCRNEPQYADIYLSNPQRPLRLWMRGAIHQI
ncbi:MAG: DUF5131 family protein [Crinalium sp.]